MNTLYSSILLAAIAMALTPGPAPDHVTTEHSEQDMVRQIREKMLPVYRKYIGVESIREIVSRQYDSRDNTCRGGYTVLLRRREYFHRRATYKVLKYMKDGKPEPAWKYNYPTRSPAYLPFGPDSETNYATRLKGKKTIRGVPCWEFEVIPKKNTSRHMRGSIYFSVKGLDLIYLEGTVAYYPPGLKSLAMAVYFKKLDDAFVMSEGSYTFVVHVPLFYPHRKFEQSFISRDDRLIPVKP